MSEGGGWYRPWEILQLTGDTIERIKEAAARRAEEFDRITRPAPAGAPAAESPASKAIAENKAPTFEQLWAALYSQVPRMTRERAKKLYDEQLAQWEAKNAKANG